MCSTDRRIRTFLESIIEECDLLAEFVKMIPEDRYLGGSITHTMLLRAIAVSEQRIGEAATQVMNLSNGTMAERYPALPWKEMRSLRNHVVHEYLSIDESIIVNTAIDDIPSIKPLILEILSDMDRSDSI